MLRVRLETRKKTFANLIVVELNDCATRDVHAVILFSIAFDERVYHIIVESWNHAVGQYKVRR